MREVIARHGLAARHSLGQHFLLDEGICDRVARAAGDLSRRHVIEVGPGPGGLTRALLRTACAQVCAIELDARALAALGELDDPRLQVIEGDATRMRTRDLVAAPRVVVANLPYNAATPLLIGWLRDAGAYERLTLMFQLEVAERICAAPDTPAYGRLSVLAQWVSDVTIAFRLPPGAFVPAPKVHSAVVVFSPHAAQPDPATFARMERLTAAAFGQRRKMLRGALRGVGGQALLDATGIAGERRAETLSVAEFAALLDAMR